MPYKDPTGLTVDEMHKLLYDVFNQYEEHQRRGFDSMVTLFAEDDFYHYHLLARAYLHAI
jgi:hypothetical protein